MRPCHGCGTALQNNIVTCPECGMSHKREGLESSAPRPMTNPNADDDRGLWMNYLMFPILVATFGSAFGAVHWGWLGVLLGLPVGLVALMMCVGMDLT